MRAPGLRRRELLRTLGAAVGTALLAGCESAGTPPSRRPTTRPAPGQPKHICRGHNECAGQGGCAQPGAHECAGNNECRGRGGCATVTHHSCAGKNDCQGLGGCYVTDRHECAGQNSCRGRGGCAIPLHSSSR